MKNSEPKRKQPTNGASNASAAGRARPASRSGEPVAPQKEVRRVQPEQPRPSVAPDASLPIPDLSKYGVAEREAREHLGKCEPCGRAHKHVVKNPKDVMALDAFGRHIATCLAVHADKPQA